MVTLHEVITFLVSMQISISSLQTHNVNRCGRSRHLARKLLMLICILTKNVITSCSEIGRAVQQECRDRSRMPSSARKKNQIQYVLILFVWKQNAHEEPYVLQFTNVLYLFRSHYLTYLHFVSRH